MSGILTLQGGMPWTAGDGSDDLDGSGMVADGVSENWNYSGPKSAFTAGLTSIPCYSSASGEDLRVHAISQWFNGVPTPPAACMTAAAGEWGAGRGCTDESGLLSSRMAVCLTPAAYGTIGNANRNIFRGPHYYNADFSVAKIWTFKERYSAQFRAEFFNVFNHADFTSTPGVTDPSKGGLFGAITSTPDSGNPVLGSGGPRHIQFALRLTF